MTQSSDIFLETLTEALKERGQIPMWGQTPTFPWKSLEKSVQKTLEKNELTITHLKSDWKQFGDFLKGFGEDPTIISCTLSPLNPVFFLVVADDDIESLTSPLLDTAEEKKTFDDPSYRQGFFRFLTLKILSELNELKPFEDLSVKMTSEPLVSEDSYCVDVKLGLPSKAITVRAIFPSTFQKVISAHFESKPASLNSVKDINPDVSLSVTCGHVSLTSNELSSLKVGDLLILDNCTFNPEKESGSMQISLEGRNLLITHKKNSQLTIVDYALYEEEPNYG